MLYDEVTYFVHPRKGTRLYNLYQRWPDVIKGEIIRCASRSQAKYIYSMHTKVRYIDCDANVLYTMRQGKLITSKNFMNIYPRILGAKYFNDESSQRALEILYNQQCAERKARR